MTKTKRWWSVREAAKYSGLPEQMLRYQMRARAEGRPGADIGLAVKGKTNRWCYYVFPEKFKNWLGEGVFVPDKDDPTLLHQIY